jgi:hypothetical protein
MNQLKINEFSQVYVLNRLAVEAGAKHGMSGEFVVNNVRVDQSGVVYFCDATSMSIAATHGGDSRGPIPYRAVISGKAPNGYLNIRGKFSINGNISLYEVEPASAPTLTSHV